MMMDACKYYLGANLQKVMYHLLCAVVGDGILRNSLYSPFLVVMFAGSYELIVDYFNVLYLYFTKKFFVSYISFLLC